MRSTRSDPAAQVRENKAVMTHARRMWSTATWAVVVLWAGIVWSGFAQASQAPAQTAYTRSVRDGVYTEAQAERGSPIFNTRCIVCHEARFWRDYWVKDSLGSLFDKIQLTMPEDAPGTLAPQEYRDVLAYILMVNKLPAGAAELPETVAELKQIKMETAAR